MLTVRGDYVLLERIKTESEFVVPDDSKDTFKVVGTGPDVDSCKIGDEVIAIEHYQGEIKLGDQKIIIVKDEDIVGVI